MFELQHNWVESLKARVIGGLSASTGLPERHYYALLAAGKVGWPELITLAKVKGVWQQIFG